MSACAWTRDDQVFCWGSNENRVIAEDKEWQFSNFPLTRIAGLPPLRRLTASSANCVTTAAKELWCWGDRAGGVQPHRMFELAGVVEGWIQYKHGCALIEDGSVWCWGENIYDTTPSQRGMLGVDPEVIPSSAEPVRVTGIDNAIAIGIGNHFTCVLRDTGVVSCWGANFAGQLGDGTTKSSWQPLDVVLPEP